MLRRIAISLAIALTLICLFLFYSQYWLYRTMFNPDGRYFDAQQGVVFHSQSGVTWASLSAFFLLIILVLVLGKR
ncbi:MAG: hypothetical protein WBC71_13685 [Salaquimonas sp.]